MRWFNVARVSDRIRGLLGCPPGRIEVVAPSQPEAVVQAISALPPDRVWPTLLRYFGLGSDVSSSVSDAGFCLRMAMGPVVIFPRDLCGVVRPDPGGSRVTAEFRYRWLVRVALGVQALGLCLYVVVALAHIAADAWATLREGAPFPLLRDAMALTSWAAYGLLLVGLLRFSHRRARRREAFIREQLLAVVHRESRQQVS